MPLLPSWLQRLFNKKRGENDRAFASDVPGLQIIEVGAISDNQTNASQEFEIFPEDPAVRRQWFSLTIRERQVVALVCMGHRNYDIASILGIENSTVQTHLQKIFRKFGLRSRGEIRTALVSWRAEDWWNHHHY